MALLASVWILPGLLGPPIGALVAETIGWRYAFLAPLPAIVIAAFLVMPALRNVEVSDEEGSNLPIAAVLILMVGAGVMLGALTDPSMWTAGLVLVGLAATILALRRVTPPGTLVVSQSGDFQSLDRANRRAAHVHLPDRTPNSMARLATLLGIAH